MNTDYLKNEPVIFFDIDGTIYDFEHEIKDSTVEAFKLLKKNNVKTVICTGRTKPMIFKSIMNLGFDAIIAGGGTYVEVQEKVIYRYDLDKKIADKVVDLMRKYNFLPIPEGHDYMYFEEEMLSEDYKRTYSIYYKEVGDYIKPIKKGLLEVAKISARYTKESNFEGIYEELNEEFDFVNHKGKLLELIPKGFSKAKGIERFLDYSGISNEKTYAIGDSMNDAQMIKYVKHGIAMGDSCKELIELADFVTDTMLNDGVYKALKKYKLI